MLYYLIDSCHISITLQIPCCTVPPFAVLTFAPNHFIIMMLIVVES